MNSDNRIIHMELRNSFNVNKLLRHKSFKVLKVCVSTFSHIHRLHHCKSGKMMTNFSSTYIKKKNNSSS